MKETEILKIKAAVRHRDSYQCTECGLSQADHYRTFGRDLEVHRLAPGSEYILKGSVTLCKDCHASKPRSKHGTRRLRNGKVQVVLQSRTELHNALRSAAREEGLAMGDFAMRAFLTDSRFVEALERIRRIRLRQKPPPPDPD